jgi:hypothetical protein
MENTRKGKMDVRQIVARQYVLLTKASSDKLQAASSKLQAPSSKQGWAKPTPGGGGKKAPATLCHIDTRYWLRRYVTLTQDVVVWLLGYSLKKNVDNLHYFVLFNNGPWYNVILTIKKEK